jgi:plastocyanin
MTMDCHGLRRHHFRRRARLAGALTFLLVAAPGPARAADPGGAVPAGRGASGRLQGTVAVGPKLSSRKIRFNLYPDPAQAATLPAQPRHEEELQNVVIYFEPSPSLAAAAAPRSERQAMRQEGLTFVPHVLAVAKGTTVDFPNGDGIFHNVFSLSKAAEFDLGRYPMGSSKSVRLDTPGIVKVFCHIHSDMSGVILVVDSPFFAVPDAQGHYSIGGVPPGEYTVVGWHERARPLRRTVRIQPGQAAVADFSIPLTESAGGD